MNIKIHNPNNLPTIDYRGVEVLQGNLKDLSEKNFDKLKRVLVRRGFTIPLFIWQNDGVSWLLDGTQRTRVMQTEDMNDEGSYKVPYILIDAADKKEAKEKLLEITSQYGHMTYEGYDAFTVDLPQAELLQTVSFDALPLLGEQTEEPDDESDKNDKPALVITFKSTMDMEAAMAQLIDDGFADQYGAQIKARGDK